MLVSLDSSPIPAGLWYRKPALQLPKLGGLRVKTADLLPVPHFLRDAPRPMGFDRADSEAAKPGDVFRAVAGTDATAVLLIVPIENVVATVLDRPVPAVDLENALRVSLLGGSAGKAVGDFSGSLTGLCLEAIALDDKGLSHVRKVEVVIEFSGGPDLAGFEASVIRGRSVHKSPFIDVPPESSPGSSIQRRRGVW